MVFSVGEKVFAKGHKTNMWYSATVTQVSDQETFDVVFEDGAVSEKLKLHEIASEGRFRRGRSRSRSRSRSRGRSKSPARKAKQSPSPSRKVKQTTNSPSRKSSRKVESSPPVKPIEVESSPARKQRITEETKVVTSTHNPMRQSARIAEKVSRHESGDGDGDITEVRKTTTTTTTFSSSSSSSSSSSKSPKKYERGGPWGTFSEMLFIPVLVMSLIWVCNEKSCDAKQFLSLHKLVPMKLSAYYDCTAVLVFLGFLAGQFLLALLPVGREVEGQPIIGVGRLKYRCNGLFAVVITLIDLAAMFYFKCGLPFAYNKFQQLAVTGFVAAILLAVFLYIKARNIKSSLKNEAGNTGCVSHDFYLGRELNPRIGPMDFKFFIFQLTFTGMICLNAAFLAQSWEKDSKLNLALLLVAALQTFYAVDMETCQADFTTAMIVAKDGCGYMLTLGGIFMPFIWVLPNKYILEHPEKWSYPWLAGIALLFVVGYVIKRGADSQKAKFRRNPHDPSLAHVETMPTTGGKRLLVSGWWGLVRHPNYLGEVLMMLAWTLPCGCGNLVPYIPTLMTIAYLFARAKEDAVWCRQKHGAPWEKYCERVKYSIVPYVY